MTCKYSFRFLLHNGLHARPASQIEEITRRFSSEIILINKQNERKANAKSVLDMIGTDIQYDDPCQFLATGIDEKAALEAINVILKDIFLHEDAPIPEPDNNDNLFLPRSLKNLNPVYYQGNKASQGIGQGKVVILDKTTLSIGLQPSEIVDSKTELKKTLYAITTLSSIIEDKIVKNTEPQIATILKAHLAIVRDPALVNRIEELVINKKINAKQAIIDAADYFVSILQTANNTILRERALDVREICSMLIERLNESKIISTPLKLSEPTIGIAENLSPSQLLALDLKQLKGLVIENCAFNSHTTILARSLNIPTIIGVKKASSLMKPGNQVIVDTNLGIIIINSSESIKRYYQQEQKKN